MVSFAGANGWGSRSSRGRPLGGGIYVGGLHPGGLVARRTLFSSKYSAHSGQNTI